jgi:tetratricopeptide (TPR) repeat protein
MGVHGRAKERAKAGAASDAPVTSLRAFCTSHGITNADLARESGVSRQHIVRIMNARMNARRDVIAAIVSAIRRMTLEAVRADELFALSVEDEAAFHAQRSRPFEIQPRASVRARAFVEALTRVGDAEKRLEIVLRAQGKAAAYPIAAALIVEARRLAATDASQGAAYAGNAAALLAVSPSGELALHLEGCAALASGVALRHLGDYPRALTMLAKAEAAFLDRPHSSASELAQTWYVRGIIAMKQSRFNDALIDARAARTVFQLLGDSRRDAYTRLLEGGVAFEQGDAHRARDLFRSTFPALRRAEEEKTLAIAWMNVGSAEARLGNLADAEEWIRRAEAVFRHRGVPEELARAHWTYGYALATHGQVQPGVIVMVEAAKEFDDLRLSVEAAFVRLDLTEVFLAQDDRDAAIETCQGIVKVLKRAGATAAARKAVEYLCRALSDGAATVPLARYVKTYALAAERGAVAPFEPRVAA